MQFDLLVTKYRKQTPQGVLLALDPGETTGFAVFTNGCLTSTGQLETCSVVSGVRLLLGLLDTLENPTLVYEDYKVYSWKAEQHSWASLHTPQLIGAIQTLCYLRQIPAWSQMAQQPKAFCTDSKLKQWGYYKPGQRHARDAIRHGCYYLLFNAGKSKINSS